MVVDVKSLRMDCTRKDSSEGSDSSNFKQIQNGSFDGFVEVLRHSRHLLALRLEYHLVPIDLVQSEPHRNIPVV